MAESSSSISAESPKPPLTSSDSALIPPLLHIAVVEFHHKKGCQVEFVHPPFSEEHGSHSNYLPEEWKHLPGLALPDGSHNFSQDSCFFHLPPRKSYTRKTTVYGVSCYRQVSADSLTVQLKDVTRGSVQKSVVALSQMPLYSFLNANLEFAAEAFLKENFTNKDVLVEFYHHINKSFNKANLSQKILSLSPKPLITRFQQKILILFKLILLERKVLVFGSPVKTLVETILGVLSLFPGMLENGLALCTDAQQQQKQAFVKKPPPVINENEAVPKSDEKKAPTEQLSSSSLVADSPSPTTELEADDEADLESEINFGNCRLEINADSPTHSDTVQEGTVGQDSASPSHHEDSESFSLLDNDDITTTAIETDAFGQPLSIFSRGHLCFPYTSLLQHQLLKSNSERGYVCGVSNALFTEQQDLADVVIKIHTGEIIFRDSELKSQLDLTAADLRFVTSLLNNIPAVQFSKQQTNDDDGDMNCDPVNWHGGDEWIRSQFELYLKSMLACSVQKQQQQQQQEQQKSTTAEEEQPQQSTTTNNDNLGDYNRNFMAAWMQTQNYNAWLHNCRDRKQVVTDDVTPVHPFRATYSINDVKLRVHHTLQSTERGKKIEGAVLNVNQAVQSTVQSTGKIVGSALVSTKSTLSSWLSNMNKNSNSFFK